MEGGVEVRVVYFEGWLFVCGWNLEKSQFFVLIGLKGYLFDCVGSCYRFELSLLEMLYCMFVCFFLSEFVKQS